MKKVLVYVWKQLEAPLIIFGISFMAGYGFYNGIMSAEKAKRLWEGRAIIITSFDMVKDESKEK